MRPTSGFAKVPIPPDAWPDSPPSASMLHWPNDLLRTTGRGHAEAPRDRSACAGKTCTKLITSSLLTGPETGPPSVNPRALTGRRAHRTRGQPSPDRHGDGGPHGGARLRHAQAGRDAAAGNRHQLVITTASGQPVTVTTTRSTTVSESGAPLSDIADGARDIVAGPESGGTIAAQNVEIVPAFRRGIP